MSKRCGEIKSFEATSDGTISAGSIPTLNNCGSILFSNFPAKESILDQEWILFISME